MEEFERNSQEHKEKPSVVYHGTVVADIQEFEPRKRFTPGKNMNERVYAADYPVHAAMHSFPWHTAEGFDSVLENGQMTFIVPVKFKERLQVPVYIYSLPSDEFRWTTEETTGHTLDTSKRVRPTAVERFDTAQAAIEHYGAQVVFKE